MCLQLDGVIARANETCDSLFGIRNVNDFEFFSGTSVGADQGYGYQLLVDGANGYGPRFNK